MTKERHCIQHYTISSDDKKCHQVCHGGKIQHNKSSDTARVQVLKTQRQKQRNLLFTDRIVLTLRDGSAVQGAGVVSRGPGFIAQHPQVRLLISVTLVPGDPTLSYRHTFRHNATAHEKKNT